jgi:hypothetical protein
MLNAATQREGHFVGADVEAAVHRRRVATDDFAAAPLGELDAERALARRRRTQDGENRRPQTLRPEDDEAGYDREQNQQAELLRARRDRHGIT